MSTFTQTTGRGRCGYLSPELHTVEVKIEQGFAASSPIEAAGGVSNAYVPYGGTIGGDEAND